VSVLDALQGKAHGAPADLPERLTRRRQRGRAFSPSWTPSMPIIGASLGMRKPNDRRGRRGGRRLYLLATPLNCIRRPFAARKRTRRVALD